MCDVRCVLGDAGHVVRYVLSCVVLCLCVLLCDVWCVRCAVCCIVFIAQYGVCDTVHGTRWVVWSGRSALRCVM